MAWPPGAHFQSTRTLAFVTCGRNPLRAGAWKAPWRSGHVDTGRSEYGYGGPPRIPIVHNIECGYARTLLRKASNRHTLVTVALGPGWTSKDQ